MENQKKKLTPKVFTNTIAMLHLFFTFPPLVFGMFVLFTMDDWKLHLDDYSDPYLYAVPIVAIICVLLSNYLYKKKISSLKDTPDLKEKLSGFQMASIISYAPLEGGALLGIVTAYNYPNIYFLIISGILLIYLLYRRPSKDKIESHLALTGALKSQFNKSDEVID